MKQSTNLIEELQLRRYRIVKILSTYLAIGAFMATGLYIFRLTREEIFFENFSLWIPNLILIISFLFSTLYIRFYLTNNHLQLSIIIIATLLCLTAVVLMLIEGTSSSMPYLLTSTAIMSTSVVLSTKDSTKFLIFVVLTTFIIYFLHKTEVLTYHQVYSTSNFADALVLAIFLNLITQIGRIGYDQIEHSYNKAFKYAAELEKLNKNLDKKVKKRTQQLEKSFNTQIDSMHKAATMGNITRAMLHDLTTPMSALKGLISLLETENNNDSNYEIISMAKSSAQQLDSIMKNSRELMKNENKIEIFNINIVADSLIQSILSELRHNEIVLNNQIDKNLELKGIPELFSRILLNLLTNSMQELASIKDKERRHINLYSQVFKNSIQIIVEDLGNGIKETNLPYIFDPDFSTKTNKGNLGLGLPFVKNSMETHFGGSIEVTSEYGKFTRFTLNFKKVNEKFS